MYTHNISIDKLNSSRNVFASDILIRVTGSAFIRRPIIGEEWRREKKKKNDKKKQKIIHNICVKNYGGSGEQRETTEPGRPVAEWQMRRAFTPRGRVLL